MYQRLRCLQIAGDSFSWQQQYCLGCYVLSRQCDDGGGGGGDTSAFATLAIRGGNALLYTIKFKYYCKTFIIMSLIFNYYICFLCNVWGGKCACCLFRS